MRQKIERESATFTCPHCHLRLHSARSGESLRLEYDIAHWRQHCVAARLGTPCVCPQFRPKLWGLLSRANARTKSH